MAFIKSLPVTKRNAGMGSVQISSIGGVSRCRLVKSVPQRRSTLNSPQMLIIDAGSIEDMDKILGNADGSLVVVDYSTSWCGPCKMIAPFFQELSEKYEDVVFVKVMGDATPEASELMRREGIRAVPAFHFWKEKKRVRDITGARKEEVESCVTELM